jgi:hypothetical protein
LPPRLDFRRWFKDGCSRAWSTCASRSERPFAAVPGHELTARTSRAAIGLSCFVLCYYGTQAIGPAVKVFSPDLPIDWRLPCIPALAWVYAMGVVWPFAVIFRVSLDSIDRSLAAYILLSVFAAVLFLLFPTDGSALRSQCDPQGEWALRTLALLDKPVNMMPSLHVGYAVLAMIFLRDNQPTWRRGALVMAVLQIFASCLTKQHFIADVAAGVALAVISYRLTRLLDSSPRAILGDSRMPPSGAKRVQAKDRATSQAPRRGPSGSYYYRNA